MTKLDSAGNERWTRQLSSARYVNRGGVAVDGLGNVYLSGSTNSPLGIRIWPKMRHSQDIHEVCDHAHGVAIDGLENVYVAGNSYGSLGGPNAGGRDAFLAKFDVNGNQYWTHQFGTSAADSAHHISVDALGNLYVVGSTRGDLGGTYSGGGGDDSFLARFSVGVPEPSLALLIVTCVLPISALGGRISRRTGPLSASYEQISGMPPQRCFSKRANAPDGHDDW